MALEVRERKEEGQEVQNIQHQNLEEKVAKEIKVNKKVDQNGIIFHLCYLPIM